MTREVDDPASEFAKFEPFLVFEENIEHILQGAGLYAIHRRKRPLNLLNTLPNVRKNISWKLVFVIKRICKPRSNLKSSTEMSLSLSK
jgi:hypothetical protein